MEQGRIDNGAGVELAWQRLPGGGPTVVFLPGYRSDMRGDKAQALAALCAREARGLLLFDYAGHGESGGRFEDGTIGRWTDDALIVIDRLTQGRLVLVGSSMGGWIGLLAALARPSRVAAFVGIAAAPDFTEALMWESMTPAERATLMQHGVLHVPSAYGEPLPITRALIEDGRTRRVMGGPIPLACPVRLLHGQADADVPWETALRLAERIEGADVQVLLVKDGGHRMSRPQDLALLEAALLPLLSQDGA
ncbi:MAG: alpha/beta hydrolase [Acetobacteraceae bacterium]